MEPGKAVFKNTFWEAISATVCSTSGMRGPHSALSWWEGGRIAEPVGVLGSPHFSGSPRFIFTAVPSVGHQWRSTPPSKGGKLRQRLVPERLIRDGSSLQIRPSPSLHLFLPPPQDPALQGSCCRFSEDLGSCGNPPRKPVQRVGSGPAGFALWGILMLRRV